MQSRCVALCSAPVVRSVRSVLTVLTVLAASGCTSPPASTNDASGDVPDAVDTVLQDAPTFVRPPRDNAGLGPVAPMTVPEALVVPEWMFATLGPSDPDGVLPAIEQGTFTVPGVGEQYDALWESVVPEPDGTLLQIPRGTGYVAANVRVPSLRRVFARADTTLAVWTNGAQQPGDLYASGRAREPLVVRPGEDNVIVARLLGGRGTPKIQLFQTPDELVFNSEDITAPDLVVGDRSEQWLGIAVLNLTPTAALTVNARVEDSADFEATAVAYPSLAGGAVTQLAFKLVPKRPWAMAGQRITVALRIESPTLDWTYRKEITLETVAEGTTFRRTFRSGIDNSAQYYGVVPPSNFDPMRQYGLVLALHGASVEGIGHARAYSRRDWNYVIAPTNRRPYGFDWELWGRLDALEVLDQATASYRIDPTRVYLTGHSMGGHGTWNIGVHFPGRFAAIGPSAGWSSFYTYTGQTRPMGVFARSRAASDTNVYLSNLARRGAYVIHGTADDNVPIREPRALVPALRMFTPDVEFWEQPGAGHWWDGMAAPGADCVDWVPLFAFMDSHRLDPLELDFAYRTPSPVVNPKHSFVTILSETSAAEDVTVRSEHNADTVVLTTQNARTIQLDGAALRARGVLRATVDGRMMDVPNGPLVIGPNTGKNPLVHGPIHQLFYRPFCFAYPDNGPIAYQRYASFLLSSWSLIGNGHGCAVPLSQVTPALRREWNIVYLGVASSAVSTMGGSLPITWDANAITTGATRNDASAAAFVVPNEDGSRLTGVFTATAGSEHLLFRYMPFTSGFVAPDYLVFGAMGVRTAGFFSADWGYVPAP